jgi:choline kinase
MKVGDVYYRRIDGVKCVIKGFFYLHYDNTRSMTVEVYSEFYKRIVKNDLRPDNIRILFHNSNYDTVENLFTSLYMGKDEWNKMQEYTQDDYDGQHAEEKVLWNDDDLVLNPGEKPKRFKLFK